MTRETTGDVDVMLGNPRKALLAMAVPVAIANIVQSLNSVIDSVWVSGLGTGPLAATGVVFPYFFIIIGIGGGLAVGASQALARRLGAEDHEGVDKVASQSIVISALVGIVLGLAFFLAAGQLVDLGGAGIYYDDCYAYAVPIFIGAPLFIVGGLLSGLLRSEGASKRSMIIQVVGALINVILDPIFIYVFGWGIAGAAWATVLSSGIPLLMAMYWYYVKKDTFTRIPLRGFRFLADIDRDILKVGIPASMEMILLSLSAVVMNVIVYDVDPVSGLAIYSTGWRILDIVMLPVMAIGFSIVPICAAAIGAKKHEKVKETYFLSLKYGVILMAVLSAIVFALAPYIVYAFTYSDASASLSTGMTEFVRIGCIFLWICPLGYTSGSLFQSMGMGGRSLICSAFLNVVRIPVCYSFSFVGTLSLIWWGVTVSEYLGAIFAFVWVMIVMRKMLQGRKSMTEFRRI